MAVLQSIARWFTPRRLVAAAALLGWVIAVVIASGPKVESDAWIGLDTLRDLATISLLLFVLFGFVVLLWVGPPGGGERKRPAKSRWAGIVTLATLAVVVLIFDPADFAGSESDSTSQDNDGEVPAEGLDADSLVAGDGVSAVETATMIVALAVVGVALWFTRARLRDVAGADMVDSDEADHDLGAAVSAAADLLLGGATPRRAVIAAYASLERALADQGQPRAPSETPSEHLARVLAVVPVLAEPAVRLGQLYELARFSDHPITADDQHMAGTALDSAVRRLDDSSTGSML